MQEIQADLGTPWSAFTEVAKVISVPSRPFISVKLPLVIILTLGEPLEIFVLNWPLAFPSLPATNGTDIIDEAHSDADDFSNSFCRSLPLCEEHPEMKKREAKLQNKTQDFFIISPSNYSKKVKINYKH